MSPACVCSWIFLRAQTFLVPILTSFPPLSLHRFPPPPISPQPGSSDHSSARPCAAGLGSIRVACGIFYSSGMTLHPALLENYFTIVLFSASLSSCL